MKTIDEIRTAKEELEKNIEEVLGEFIKKTGLLPIVNIEFKRKGIHSETRDVLITPVVETEVKI